MSGCRSLSTSTSSTRRARRSTSARRSRNWWATPRRNGSPTRISSSTPSTLTTGSGCWPRSPTATRRASTPTDLDYRLIARDGRVVWIRDEEIVVADAEGRLVVAQGYLQDVTARRQDSARLELLVGILSLAADETPPDEIVAAIAAESLAELFGDVDVSYVERADEGGFWIRYPTTRASRSSGTRSSGRRLHQPPQQGDRSSSRTSRRKRWLDPIRDRLDREQRRLVRRRAAASQRRS